MINPHSGAEYHDRVTAAVVAVLIELGQVLGAFRERFVIIGGSVPWLLFPDADPQHIGTLDVDLALDAEALVNDDDYAGLIEVLENNGYKRSVGKLKQFQLLREVPVDAEESVAVIVDLLMPRDVKLPKHTPPLIADLRVQRADGVCVAMREFVEHRIEGMMPDGRPNAVNVRVASIPAFLVMKGYAIGGRNKPKDVYDIYFSVREFAGGPVALADACRHLMDDVVARRGYEKIADKFRHEDAFGPVTVREFLSATDALGGMTPEQAQVDAYRQVRSWLRALALRE